MASRFKFNSAERRSLQGARVLILKGRFVGEQGVCLGPSTSSRFAVSPDCSNAIVAMKFERDCALLILRRTH